MEGRQAVFGTRRERAKRKLLTKSDKSDLSDPSDYGDLHCNEKS
jgi:hypothetical protein